MSAPPISVQPRAEPAPRGKSLWRELCDGSAHWVVRGIVTVALGAVLSGVCFIGAYLLAAMFPQLWDRWYGWNGSQRSRDVRPSEELVAWLFVIAGLAYLAAIAWIWSRALRRHRVVWYAAIATILIAAVTIAAGVLAEESLGGDEELVLVGIACLGVAGTLLVWLEAWRRYGRGRSVTNEQDGLPDVRCPTCSYRMVGLYESRCPECGTAYTLEDLLGRQEFLTGRAAGTAPPAPPAAASMPSPAHADRLPPVPPMPAATAPGAG